MTMLNSAADLGFEGTDGVDGGRKPVSINDRVYLDIRARIVKNRLRPGHKLGVLELAELLKVSRTPVREALERLYQQGLASRIPRRGFFVSDIGNAQVKELYQTREALELFALDLAMQKGISAKDVRRLDAIQKAYRKVDYADAAVRRAEIDRDLHLELARLSGNSYMVRSLAGAFEGVLRKHRIEGYTASARRVEAVAQHEQLLEAIRKGDKASAIRILRNHIRSAWESLDRHLTAIA